ncbi:hypothetical protein Tco_0580908 [Tanacetum coccineum]
MDCLSGVAIAILDELVSSITQVMNLFLEGKCPMMLGEYIASAPLTPVVKLGGGICPITVGTFRGGVPGGGEAILHAVNHLVEDRRDDVGLSMLLVDFQNAFNLSSATLSLPDCTTESTPCVHAKGCSRAWYLDDGTIVGDTLVIGLSYWVGLLLGGPVMKRVSKTIGLFDVVAKINDPQCELLLIRYVLSRLLDRGLGTGNGDSPLYPLHFGALLLRHVGIVASGPTFDDALCVFNKAMEIDFLNGLMAISKGRAYFRLPLCGSDIWVGTDNEW